MRFEMNNQERSAMVSLIKHARRQGMKLRKAHPLWTPEWSLLASFRPEPRSVVVWHVCVPPGNRSIARDKRRSTNGLPHRAISWYKTWLRTECATTQCSEGQLLEMRRFAPLRYAA